VKSELGDYKEAFGVAREDDIYYNTFFIYLFSFFVINYGIILFFL
jgi:hypothetical protein